MTVYAAPNALIEASLQAVQSGGAGTYRIGIIDTPNGLVFLEPTTSGIVERPSGSGIYHWSGQGPTTPGIYSIVWDFGTGSRVIAVEELVVGGSRAPDAVVPGPRRSTNAFARLMPERCDVLRFDQIGSEDGTPIITSTRVDQNVPCRLDLTKGSHRDMLMRTGNELTTMNYAIAVMVHDANVRAGDRLKMTRGVRSAQIYQVFSAEIVLGFDKPHHLEAEVRLVEGAI